MAREKFAVRLTPEQRDQLEHTVRAGQGSARVINRARVLLKIDEGWRASRGVAAMEVTERTVFRIKRRYVEEGLAETLHRCNQVNRHRKADERVEAHLIALACSAAPEGHDH